MNLQIIEVKDSGILSAERLLLRAREDADVGEYMVGSTVYQGEGQVSSRLRHVLWLPDRDVSAGDLVVVYTKDGTDKSRENESGNRTHFLYWGLSSPIWRKGGGASVLFHIDEWQHKMTGSE